MNRSARSNLGIVLAACAAMLLGAASTVVGEDGMTREQALSALSSRDVQARRGATGRLADVGTMADMKVLAKALRDTDDETRALAQQAMWQVWAHSGDAEIDALYKTGVDQMAAGEVQQSIATFTRIIERKPEFAEGWNKRATLYFIAGDMRKSLADCDEVMKRNPYHFGALSGYVMIYVRLEFYERALEYARRALEINPNLQGVRQNMELIEHVLEQRRKQTI